MPLKGDAAHISIDAVIAQTESTRQLFAAQQFAILHIGALKNIDPVMPAVSFNFFKLEARVSVEHSSDHLEENLKEQRSDKRELRCNVQTVPIRLYTYSYGFFYQAYGLLAGNVLDHLKINRSPREDNQLGMYLFFCWKHHKLVTQIVEKLPSRANISDTDKGAEILEQMQDLQELLDAYRSG